MSLDIGLLNVLLPLVIKRSSPMREAKFTVFDISIFRVKHAANIIRSSPDSSAGNA
jgi:cyanate permease